MRGLAAIPQVGTPAPGPQNTQHSSQPQTAAARAEIADNTRAAASKQPRLHIQSEETQVTDKYRGQAPEPLGVAFGPNLPPPSTPASGTAVLDRPSTRPAEHPADTVGIPGGVADQVFDADTPLFVAMVTEFGFDPSTDLSEPFDLRGALADSWRLLKEKRLRDAKGRFTKRRLDAAAVPTDPNDPSDPSGSDGSDGSDVPDDEQQVETDQAPDDVVDAVDPDVIEDEQL